MKLYNKSDWENTKNLQRDMIFCRILPSEINDNDLGMSKLRGAIYDKIFEKNDDLTRHTQREKMFNKHLMYITNVEAGVDTTK